MGVKGRERDGAWWLFIDHKGRRKAKRVGSGKVGLRAARAAAEKIQAKLALGETAMLDETRDPALTVTFVENWLKHHVAVHCKPGTAEKYEMIFRKHWLPALGRLPLISVTREHIKAVLAAKLGADLKPRTVKGLLDVLRACLSEAVEDKLIPVNPAARLGKLVPRFGDNPEIDIFTGAEVTTVLEVAELDMPDAYPIVLTLARTGLRIGEALSLQAEDVDFAQRTLWVRRTWGSRRKALGDRRINGPKNNRVRRVDMSNQFTRVLQGLLAVQAAEAIVKGHERSPWLFLGRGDGPMTPGSFWQNVWRPLLRRAGLPYRKPHTLRHTYASLLIQNGESLAYIRDQLGHHSIKLTVDTYGHLVPGVNRAAVDRLDDATGRNLYATGTR